MKFRVELEQLSWSLASRGEVGLDLLHEAGSKKGPSFMSIKPGKILSTTGPWGPHPQAITRRFLQERGVPSLWCT